MKRLTLLSLGLSIISVCAAESVPETQFEDKVFYYESCGADGETDRSAKLAGGTNEVKSVVRHCFDENNIGKNAWLMTADGATGLDVSLYYPGQDDRYTIASHEVSFYFYDGQNFFQDDNKVEVPDVPAFVGRYTSTQSERGVVVELTAPESFPTVSNSWYSFYTVIQVNFVNGGSAAVAKKIGVSRPGVLLLHGLNANSSTFKSFKSFLESTVYIPQQIYSQDYSQTNTSSFWDNTHVYRVVERGLQSLSDQLFSLQIASAKYDMIGHSMGGILERLYVQEIDNLHTNKLITLNTPHFGAPLGNVAPVLFDVVENAAKLPMSNNVFVVLKNVLEIFFNPNDGREAVSDLGLGSAGINNLNSSTSSRLAGIPMYAVGSYLNNSNVETTWSMATRPMSYEGMYLLSRLFAKDASDDVLNAFLGRSRGDAIVSVESQRGGLADRYCSIFQDDWKYIVNSHAFHCNSPDWDVVHNELSYLLYISASDSRFCKDGFGNEPSGARAMKSAVSDLNFMTEFNEVREESFIRIGINKTEVEGASHRVAITVSPDVETFAVFAVIDDDKIIADYDKSEMLFDMSGIDRELTVYAVGRTSYDAFVIDSVKLNPSEASVIGISDPGITYAVSGDKLELYGIEGAYNVIIYDVLGRRMADYRSNAEHTYDLPGSHAMAIVEVRSRTINTTFKIKI